MRFFKTSKTTASADATRVLLQWESLMMVLLALSNTAVAIPLTLDDPDSVKQAASTVAYNLMKQYTGNNSGDVPGNLPSPYYWWECGAMFGAMINYWHFTGDDTYNEVTMQAMMHQVGTNNDYMPTNQTSSLGNDDQGFWAMAAMQAAEHNFPNPPTEQPQWLELVQAVFNEQAGRWDNTTCGGGLHWQIFFANAGYYYKNSISNGALFNIGARLAKYTGNQTYADWAVKVWDWTQEVGLISDAYDIWDGTDSNQGCIDQDRNRWTYNNGIYLLGAANMYNLTDGDPLWRDRIVGLIQAASVFYDSNGVMQEGCEIDGSCHTDQFSFKAYLSRWNAATTQIAPFTYDLLMPKLRTSAAAAALQCSGGPSGSLCGTKWTAGAVYDGVTGVGQDMSALEVIQAHLITYVKPPVTNSTGGTSRGNPNAGGNGQTALYEFTPITAGDRVGASMLMIISTTLLFGTFWWMMV